MFQDLLNLFMMMVTNFALVYLPLAVGDSCSSVKYIPNCFTFVCKSSRGISCQCLGLYVLSLVDPADDANIFAFIAGLAGSNATVAAEAEAEAEDCNVGDADGLAFGDGLAIGFTNGGIGVCGAGCGCCCDVFGGGAFNGVLFGFDCAVTLP